MEIQTQTVKNRKPTIAQIIKRDPKWVFRAAEVIAFSTDPDNDQDDHITLFDPKESIQSHPVELIDVSKVIFGVPDTGGLHSLWITNAAAKVPIEGKIVHLARQIGPGYMTLPAFNHATWRHVARVTGHMSAVCWNGRQALSLNTETLGVEIIHGMQGVFSRGGDLILHVFGNGLLYEFRITRENMDRQEVPKPIKMDENINCCLSIPSPTGRKMLIGRDDGLYLGDARLSATEGYKVRYLSAASEIRRVFWRAGEGETWGMQFHDGCVASDIVQVDGPRDCQLHFAGTTFARGEDGAKNQTLALYRLREDPKGRKWISERTLVRLPPALMANPNIALTIM